MSRQAGRKGAGVALALALATSGCISTSVDEIAPSFETLQLLRQQDVPAMAMGPFALADGKVGRTINIRGSTMKPLKGSSYAEFLGESFATELRASGKLDPTAPLIMAGILTESAASENVSRGKAALGARIRLLRAGVEVFSKDYRATSEWKSDFIGAIAIPDAFRNYNALYAQLVRQVLTDPEFVAAAKAG